MMRKIRLIALCFVLLIVGTGLTGCSSLKASPAEDSGFLAHPELLHHNDDLPFHAVWVTERLNRDNYDSIYIAKIDTSYLHKVADWDHIQVLSEEEIKSEARELASYFREILKKDLKRDHAELVDKPRAGTVVLEIAIVELVPTDVVRNAAGTVAGFLVPGGGLVSAGSGGSIAIEGRYRDFATKKILSTFKDREGAKIAPVDITGLTPFHFARNAIDDWGNQISEIIVTPTGTPVADSSPFTLSPW